MRQDLWNRLPGILLTAVFVVLEALFFGIIMKAGLIPGKLLVLLAILLIALAVGAFFLVWNVRKLTRFIIGSVLIFAVSAGICVGSYYIKKGVNTLEMITETTIEIAEVGVYVRKDDPAQSINDTANYTYGILKIQDRENTDKALVEITAALENPVPVKEYAGLGELMAALFETEEVQCIVVNSGFLGLLSDMEEYGYTEEDLREVHVQKVETVIEKVTENPKHNKVDPVTGEETDEEALIFTLYISGIDSRSGMIAKSRSDVNIIATVNAETHQILLVSTPRDFYVPLSISDGIPDKLTHAGIYGVQCSMDTLGMLYQTEIDYYFRVNFSGFEQIIDALGGINVNSPVSFSSNGYSYVEGDNYLGGAAALNFARERYAFASGDRQRGKNQMAVIKGVINKAVSPALLANYTSVLEGVSGSFETSMPYDLMAELLRRQISEGGSWNIVSYSVDGTGASKKPYSLSTNAYVMEPNYDTVNTAIYKIWQVMNGETISE